MTAGAYGLTRRQREAMLAIQELCDAGTPPSYAELLVELEISSKSLVYEIARALAGRGWVDWLPARPRSICVLRRLDPPEEFAFELTDLGREAAA